MAVYFSIFLVAITLLTGIVWLANKFYLAPKRVLKLENDSMDGRINPTEILLGNDVDLMDLLNKN